MTKDIGCKVRVANKLDARDFGEAHADRKPGALGKVCRIGDTDQGDWRVVIHDDGTVAPYDADELTPLDAPMVLDGEHKYPDASFDDGTPVESVDEVEREKFYGNFEPMMRACMRLQVANGGCAVAMLDGKARYVRVRVSQSETPDEHAASDSKANRDRWIALGLTDGVYPEPGFVHSLSREAMLLDACERLTGQLANALGAHRVLDEAKVLSCADGRMLNLTQRVQVLLAMRDSKQWGDEPRPTPRPRVSRFIAGNDDFRCSFDDRGAEVASVWHTGHHWCFDVRVALKYPERGDGFATAEEAEQAAYAVLRTWADVEGEESDAPKASEGFGGTRVRTLGEAVDGAHVVRLALYSFADGSEVPYLEAHETHDGARAGRVMSLSAAVHLMQNVSDDEVWTIGSREKAGESK